MQMSCGRRAGVSIIIPYRIEKLPDGSNYLRYSVKAGLEKLLAMIMKVLREGFWFLGRKVFLSKAEKALRAGTAVVLMRRDGNAPQKRLWYGRKAKGFIPAEALFSGAVMAAAYELARGPCKLLSAQTV